MVVELSAVRLAREKAKQQLKVLEQKGRVKLAGIGIGKDDDGLCVKVLLKEPARDEAELPKAIDGIKIAYSVNRRIRAFAPRKR